MSDDSNKPPPNAPAEPAPGKPPVPPEANLPGMHDSTVIWTHATAGGSAGGTGNDSGKAGSAAADSQSEVTAIGKYRVVGVLDSGGQGDVYRAVHPQLQKELVIKLGRRQIAGERDAQDRLLAEGRVLAELDHPHLARVYDLDFHERRPYLVMEYIRGRNLRQYAHGGSLPWRESARLIGQAGRALAVAHAHGVLHLDVKPENIIVDERGNARLIDFGMARLRHAWTDDAPQPGSISGTIPFMAPEQARGETDQLDQRTDVFGLGAVLYWLLTGKPPFGTFQAPNALVAAQGCTFDRAALERADAPRPLVDACLKAMAADQAGRFASAEAFAEALESVAAPSAGKRSLASMSIGNLGCAVTISACAMFIVVGYAVQHTWEQRRRDEQVAIATPSSEKAKPKTAEPPPPDALVMPPGPVSADPPDYREMATPQASRGDPPEFGFLSVDIKLKEPDDSASLFKFDRRVRLGEDQLVCSIELPENVAPAVFHARYSGDVKKVIVERFEMKLEELVDAKVKYNRWKWESAITTADAKADAGRGTHIYFVCASDATAPTLEAIRSLVELGEHDAPDGDWVIRFDRRKAEFWGAQASQLPQPPTPAGIELEAMRSRLDQLSKRLAEQYKYVSGVAFPAD